jgi:polyhydroxybutyrate depolymerase
MRSSVVVIGSLLGAACLWTALAVRGSSAETDPAPSGAAAPPASANEVAPPLAPGEHTRTLRVGERTRTYRIHVPKGRDPEIPCAVVVAFHGGGGNADSMIRLSGLNAKADEAGFVVVYPYGSARFGERQLTFNAGLVGGFAKARNIDDVGFTRALLDDLERVVRVDPDRVFATGMSNGAMMAYRVACELSDRIAAIAPVGAPMGIDDCRPTRPVPVMHFHGTADELAPFAGGYGRLPTGGKGVTDFPPVAQTIRRWVEANGCDSEPVVEALPDAANDGTRVTTRTWRSDGTGAEVVLVEIESGGHTWPGMPPVADFLGPSTRDISANDLMWEFFTRHPRRPRAPRLLSRAPRSWLRSRSRVRASGVPRVRAACAR